MHLQTIDVDKKIRSQSSTLILGSPGFGKSIFMLLLMILELQHRSPFCLIDMHGTLYKKLVTWCAFKCYSDRRVILIDPSEGNYVKPLGSFREIPGIELGVQTSSMVEAVLSVWGDHNANSYPVMFKLLKIFFTILVEKDMPLTEAFHLLGNRDALNTTVHTLSDPYIKTIWADLKKLPHFEWSRQVTPTLNRLFRIVQSKAVQRFMSASKESNLDITFEDIILVNLGKSTNLDTDAANMFAVLLINNLYQRALRRRGENGQDPKAYPVYIDEWLVSTPDFSRILAQTRKFGLLLTLANQDLSQIQAVFGAPFAQSILTLCQVQYCFGGINDSDATRLAREWVFLRRR